MTRQTSIQLTPETKAQIEALGERGFGTQSNIIRTAIKRMYQEEIEMKRDYKAIAKARINADGDLYADRDILLEYDWDNMVEHYEWVATADKAEIVDWIRAIRIAENAVA